MVEIITKFRKEEFINVASPLLVALYIQTTKYKKQNIQARA
jgi:hypothetical protein